MKIYPYMLAFMMVATRSFGQFQKQFETRPIIVSYNDSVVHANIITENVSVQPHENLYYYWYFADRININQGGYHGNLLHGPYYVFDENKRMITQGAFLKGLKSGIWKSWYPDGHLRSVIPWKGGMIDGKTIFYNPNGSVYETAEYHSGLLDGEHTYFIRDSMVVEKYCDGKRLPIKEKKKR